MDKVLKLSAGVQWARAQGCEYVVFTDADDLVSNRIAGYVANHRGENGWYCASEMFYTYGGRLIRFFDIPAPSAGPCVIVRADLLKFGLYGPHGEMVNTLAAVGHEHYREHMSKEGYPLNSLPFPANVVINHHDSTSSVSGGLGSYPLAGFRTRLRRFLRLIPTVRLMTRSVRGEFLIPPKDEIPRRYRVGTSLFWR